MTFRRLILLQSLSINAGTLHIPIFKPFRLVTPEVSGTICWCWERRSPALRRQLKCLQNHRFLTPKCDSLPCRKGECSSFSHTNSRVFLPSRFWHDERYLRDRLLPERREGFAACPLDVPRIAERWSLHNALRRLVTKRALENCFNLLLSSLSSCFSRLN